MPLCVTEDTAIIYLPSEGVSRGDLDKLWRGQKSREADGSRFAGGRQRRGTEKNQRHRRALYDGVGGLRRPRQKGAKDAWVRQSAYRRAEVWGRVGCRR